MRGGGAPTHGAILVNIKFFSITTTHIITTITFNGSRITITTANTITVTIISTYILLLL